MQIVIVFLVEETLIEWLSFASALGSLKTYFSCANGYQLHQYLEIRKAEIP